MTFKNILNISPYLLNSEEKEVILTKRLLELTNLHYKLCKEYCNILNTIGYRQEAIKSYKDLPFLPVRLFKELTLKSISDKEIVKTMTSSGTSGQQVSKIFLDKTTSSNQQKAMVKIVNDFTGSSRMPMIIIDCPSVIKDRTMFSARGAGILGFSIFASKKVYALDDKMHLNVDALREFLHQHQGETILLFGFTFMVWQYFYKELVRLKKEGISFDLSNGILIHGGGWKKLINEAVNSDIFHNSLKTVCQLNRIHDYYGMVEQTGCIYMECECGHLHASIFSDVITRRPEDFSICKIGEPGILQVLSTIPESYPGHSLLTEDEGVILGEDDCPCGRKGKYFKILGRLKNAELRGCSDTFAADHSNLEAAKLKEAENDVLHLITYLIGNKELVLNISAVPPKAPFSDDVIDFLNDLSQELMKNTAAKAFPDIVTLGFWLRKASLLRLKETYSFHDNNKHIGRGTVFHIAPSNVPINYAYSLFTGLLCGNANIVRVSSRDFPQINIVNHAIYTVLNRHKDLKPYIILVKYDHNKFINDRLSALCDTRIIWGGNATIAELRNSPLPPRSTDITFADRYSLAVIDSDEYMRLISSGTDEKTALHIAVNFYNDTYLSDQNACTSPYVIVWMGTAKEKAKKYFWQKLYQLVKNKYFFQPIQGIDKLSTEYAAASYITKMKQLETADNRLIRIHVSELSPKLMAFRGNSGYFYEYDCSDISEIRALCDNTHCQTIGLIGDSSLLTPLFESGIRGVDRIVPIGHTMDFDLIWDGYNLVDRLTRTICILTNNFKNK